MEPATLIKDTFVPERDTIFLYDDVSEAVAPTIHYSYFNKANKYLYKLLELYEKFYNKDCYNCLDTGLIKYVYMAGDYNVDIGMADFYLPQLGSPEIFKIY